MPFKKELIQLQREIDKRLEIFFEKKLRESENSWLSKEMVKSIKDFSLRGGKRIRPILFYYGYLIGGGKKKKEALDASISVELIHNFLLIHDDIIDRDDLRRGEPTIHHYYEKIYQKTSKDALHLGNSAAILAGDITSVFGYEILANSNFPTLLKNKAIQKLNQTLSEVVDGQVLDVFLKINYRLNEKEIFKIMEKKTAKYTFEAPLSMGAILAGAGKKTLTQINKFALPLGISFQIRDDILGMFGDEEKTGKPSGADLREGKQTILIFFGRQLANKEQKKIIDQNLGNPKLTREKLEKTREIIIKTGALSSAQNLAKEFSLKAKEEIKKTDFPLEAKIFLEDFTEYIAEREK